MYIVHLIGYTRSGKSIQFPQERRIGALFARECELITHIHVVFEGN